MQQKPYPLGPAHIWLHDKGIPAGVFEGACSRYNFLFTGTVNGSITEGAYQLGEGRGYTVLVYGIPSLK